MADTFQNLRTRFSDAARQFQGGYGGQLKDANKMLPGFITIGFVLVAIIVITSSIGISEYGKMTKSEREKTQAGYTAQIVFLVIALLALIGLIVMTALMYKKV